LRLFAADTPPRIRRGKLVLVATVLAAAVALTWPVYPLFASARPFLLGLPLSFAWVILWLLAVFAALIIAYRAEYGGGAGLTAGGRREASETPSDRPGPATSPANGPSTPRAGGD
jgi:hypothetical protein